MESLERMVQSGDDGVNHVPTRITQVNMWIFTPSVKIVKKRVHIMVSFERMVQNGDDGVNHVPTRITQVNMWIFTPSV